MPARILRISLIALATVAGAVALVVGAWLIDDHLVHGDNVARNVSLEGRRVGGLGEADLAEVVDALAADVALAPFALSAPGTLLTARNDEIGIHLDVGAVTETVMEAGRDAGLLGDLASWLRGLVEVRHVDAVYRLDSDTFTAWLAGRPERVRKEPVEPSFSGETGEFVVEPGVPGAQIDVAAAATAATEALDAGDVPLTVRVEWSVRPPETDDAELAEALAAAERLAEAALTVRLDSQVVRIGSPTIRRWIVSAPQDGALVPVIDPDRAGEAMERLFDGVKTEGTPPVFTVVDDAVEVEFGVPALKCCDENAGEVVAKALRTGDEATLLLPLVALEDEETQVARLGVTELVGEFTTNHNCCESRVENIHRIADLVRGVVIEPGERFSINEFVGRRTVEKGFVSAGTIESGHFTPGVGGGISQFATTMFNAAFFAGLDFDEYQSHSIYISRYPYGREATLSYPAPDLAVVNNTPYGMLIWTKYTGTSITVQLWSTRYFTVEQTGQSSYKVGACTRVETYRSRTDPNGVVIDDEVFATYRPGEGLDCNGRRTPEP